jgi:hypothetical protein
LELNGCTKEAYPMFFLHISGSLTLAIGNFYFASFL